MMELNKAIQILDATFMVPLSVTLLLVWNTDIRFISNSPEYQMYGNTMILLVDSISNSCGSLHELTLVYSKLKLFKCDKSARTTCFINL